MSKPFFNIIFCIYGCDTIEVYKKEILKVKDTWGKVSNLYKLLFFLGVEGDIQDPDCIHLENVNNDYLSAGFKQYGGLKYIYENFLIH